MTTINLTQALCLTLVHSLWQGFLAAVAAGIIILSTRKSRAAVRYNLLTADLVLFLLVAGFTFFHELGGGSGPVTGRIFAEEETGILSVLQQPASTGAASSPGIVEQFETFLQTHASTVVIIWMFCLLGQLVQLTGGLYHLGQLRRRRVFAPAAGWQERLQALAKRLGIERPVSLIESVRVKVPVTFGFLKPSILVPLGLLANLPADQVETILLHELAHIRRNDYLANLLLHLAEAVFFFNPGVRWIASLVREEREACCDDMVLMGTADRNSYFDALVAFGEFAVSGQRYGLQLSKDKTDLLWRIRRMLNQENKKLHIMEKTILIIGLTALLAVGLFSIRAENRQPGMRNTVAQLGWQATDTLPASAIASATRVKAQFPSISTNVEDNGSQKKYKIDATDADGNTFQLTKVNGAVTELIINGKVIPQTDFDQYLYIFEEIEGRSHETAEEQENEDKVSAVQREMDKVQERLDAANQEQEEAQERERVKMEEAQEKLQAAQEQEEAKQQEAAEKVQQEAEQRQEASEKARQEAVDKQQEAVEKQQEATEKQQEAVSVADRLIHQIVRDMIANGLVGSKEEVHSFSLDNDGLTLNGTPQPAETYKLFREKYIKSPNEHYIFSREGTGTTTDVKQERGN
jgi:bla regulator protein blaR1